jgi:hypothetical protein
MEITEINIAKQLWGRCNKNYPKITIIITELILPSLKNEDDIEFWNNVSNEIDKLYFQQNTSSKIN